MIRPLDLGAGAAACMKPFLVRFASLRPQLADASLCYLADREGWGTIFTLDRRDFNVYRRVDGTPFRLLPER